jgi:hypothetical protein
LLHYFRLNDPYRVIGLLVVLLLIYVPFMVDLPSLTFPELKGMIVGEKIGQGFSLYTEVIDSTPPFTGWFLTVTDYVFGHSLLGRHILAFFILFIEVVFLGIIFIDKKAFPESSFIPSLIFGILCAFSFDTLSLSGELLATFFLLLALNSLFKEIESREPSFEMVLKIGVFIGIASLFDFSFIVYVFAALIIISLYTRTSGRKIGLLVTGFLIPHLLLITIYYIKDGVGDLWNFFYLPNLGFSGTGYVHSSALIYLLAVPLAFFVASLVLLNRESRFTKYQSQLLQAMFFWTIFSFVQAYYSKEFRPQSFLPVMIGLSFFISHFFSIVARRRFAEIAFWLFLAGIVSVGYMSRYDIINKGVYERLLVSEKTNNVVSGKKVIVLAEDLSIYRHNQMATPFLNWRLSEEIFNNPEYYDHVVKVYQGFKTDTPDVIVDPNNLMKAFLDRIPELRRQYSKSAEGYRKIPSRQ